MSRADLDSQQLLTFCWLKWIKCCTNSTSLLSLRQQQIYVTYYFTLYCHDSWVWPGSWVVWERSSLNCVNGPKQVLFSFIWPNLVLSEITCKVRPVHTGLPSNLANRTLIWPAECGKMVTEIRKKIMANCSLSRHYRKIKISFLLSFIFIYKYKIYYH